MQAKKLMIFITFLLIAGIGYGYNGPDSLTIVVSGRDTLCSTPPAQGISASNAVKEFADQERDIIAEQKRQITELKLKRNVLTLQNDVLKKALIKANEGWDKSNKANKELTNKMKWNNRTRAAVIAIAAMEFIVILLIK